MTVLLNLHLCTGRVVPPGGTYGDEPLGVFLVTWLNPQRVEVSLAFGEFSIADLSEMTVKLSGHGVEFIEVHRVIGRKVPGGRIIELGERLNKWEIDVKAAISRMNLRRRKDD